MTINADITVCTLDNSRVDTHTYIIISQRVIFTCVVFNTTANDNLFTRKKNRRIEKRLKLLFFIRVYASDRVYVLHTRNFASIKHGNKTKSYTSDENREIYV